MEFVEVLIKSIVENKDMPKVQVEREISPILDIFMKDILNNTIGNGNNSFEHIMSEFPIQSLKKEENKLTNRSVNIDNLYLKDRDTLVFIELKTDNTSYRIDQTIRYINLLNKINNQSASFCFEFLEKLSKESSKKDKYKIALRRIEEKFDLNQLKAIKKTQLVYIVPSKIQKKIEKESGITNIINFTQVSNINVKEYKNEWKIIAEYLKDLDEN